MQLHGAEEKRVAAVAKQASVTAKKDEFESNLDDVSNLLKRARRAYEKAADESRWPAKFSGASFSEPELKKLIVSTARYVEARGRLKDQYASTLRKIDDKVLAIGQYIDQLKEQEERLALEYERIKLAKENIDDKELGKLAFDIAATTENLLQEDPDAVDLDDLMKANREKQDENDFLKAH